MALKIRRDDSVQVIVRQGLPARPARCCASSRRRTALYVEGLNIVKRHQRPRSLKDTQRGGKVGGVIEKEGPIHLSNVMLVDPKENQPDAAVGVERSGRQARARHQALEHEDRGLMAAEAQGALRAARSSRS